MSRSISSLICTTAPSRSPGNGAASSRKCSRNPRPPRQSLSPDQQHSRTGLQGQARAQCHGVGGLTEEGRPLPHAVGWHLIGQQPHCPPGPQRLDHLAHTRQGGSAPFQGRAVRGHPPALRPSPAGAPVGTARGSAHGPGCSAGPGLGRSTRSTPGAVSGKSRPALGHKPHPRSRIPPTAAAWERPSTVAAVPPTSVQRGRPQREPARTNSPPVPHWQQSAVRYVGDKRKHHPAQRRAQQVQEPKWPAGQQPEQGEHRELDKLGASLS
jgi:hypothetical protein